MSNECPRCGPERRLIEELLKNQKLALTSEEFYEKVIWLIIQLNEAKAKPYPVIFDYLSKNLF
jgi:hypothetical protein